MKSIKSIVLLLILIFLFNTHTYAESEVLIDKSFQEDTPIELTLEEALKLAVDNNQGIELKRLERDRAEILYKYNIDAVRAAEKAIDLKIPVPRTYEVTPDENVNRNLVRNGASRRSVELSYELAKNNLELERNKVSYDAEKSYFDLLNLMKDEEIAKENYLLAQKQYNNGLLRYNVGLMSKQQLIGLEVAKYQAESLYRSSSMYLDIQKMNFNTFLGLPLNTNVVLKDMVAKKSYEPIDISESIISALESNLRLKMAKENYEISKLTLSAKDIKGMGIYYRYQEQEVLVKEAEINLKALENSIEFGLRSSYLSLTESDMQIETMKKTVNQAEEALRITELSFQLGQNTANDVTQANINLMNAKKSLAQQIHAFNLALLDFEYSTGIGK